MSTKITKVVAAVAGFAVALSIFAGVGAVNANAQSSMTAEQLVNLFISLGIISPDKAAAARAAVTSSASVSFTRDLTVGSTGADVTALQNFLKVSPATGYFGSITKAAVTAYQASKGIPSTGYFGPLTRASVNGSGTVTTGGTTTGGTVVNSGVEGTLTIEKASISNSTVYEGDTMHTVLGLKAEAKLSDINIQRVKLNLGASTSIYTKIFKTVYLVDDAGRVLAQADLNSNTVVKDSSNYYLTLGGFSYNVPKDSAKYLWLKADTYSSIDSDDFSNPRTITVAADGVRGIDGAGIDQYSPASSIAQNITIAASLVDSASLDVSLNSANFKASDVIAKDGAANDEADKVNLLAFDFRANKADISVTDITVAVTGSISSATTTNIYLYDGSTLIQQESVNTTGANAGYAIFEDIDNLVVSKDGTKTLTVKADIREADATATTIKATVTSVSAENFQGDEVSNQASLSTLAVAGENMTVRNIGPVFTLVGTPTMTRTPVASADAGLATSTGAANFTVGVTALGGDIVFGSTGSTTTLFGTNGLATTTTTWLSLYKNGSSAGSIDANDALGTSAILSYSVPSSGVTTSGESFTLAKNNSVQIPATVSFTIAAGSSNNYAVQINGFRWFNSTVGYADTTSMSGKTEWRTPTVQLP